MSQAPISPSRSTLRWHSSLIVAGCGLLAVLIAGPALFMGSMFVPAVLGAAAATSKQKCANNLSKLTLALTQYHDVYQSFPPPYIADSKGRPIHSWRVLILPFLDQKSLYQQYRFDEPWDGPNNHLLHDTALAIFQCPAHAKTQPSAETNYVAVVGRRTVWQEDAKSPIRMADIIDGTSNTILLVEVENSGIHWMEPRDLHVLQMPMAVNARGQGISSNHPGGANVAFPDGSVRFFPSTIERELLIRAITRNGKEPPGALP